MLRRFCVELTLAHSGTSTNSTAWSQLVAMSDHVCFSSIQVLGLTGEFTQTVDMMITMQIFFSLISRPATTSYRAKADCILIRKSNS